MRRSRFLCCAALAVGSLLACVRGDAQDASPPKRIAVLNFDNPNVGPDPPSGLFGADAGAVGPGVSAKLIQKLLHGGKYTIVDRSALADLLAEQSKADRDALDPYAMAARVGRLLGLDAMIVGAVTRYGVDDGSKSGGVSLSGIRSRKSRAFVEISANVFSITSAEVLAAFTAKGQSAGLGEITVIGARGPAKNSMQMLSGDFLETLFPEATSNAIDQLASQLDQFADKIPRLHVAIDGLVAEVAGNTLTLNLGKRSGLKIGDRIEILRSTAALAAPPYPAALLPIPQHLGSATVTEVADDYATATFSGPAPPQIGDRVTRIDTPHRALP